MYTVKIGNAFCIGKAKAVKYTVLLFKYTSRYLSFFLYLQIDYLLSIISTE